MIERIETPKALVLASPGLNRDLATARAYELAGATADVVHISELKEREVNISDYQIFSIPGGFSYGDHIRSGIVLALELEQNVISDQIYRHLEKGRLILGVCNGFQALVQSGLLPFGKFQPLHDHSVALTYNKPSGFQSRWVHLKPAESNCLFVREGNPITVPIAHGEGRFVTNGDSTTNVLFENNQVVYQYCTAEGILTDEYPQNPNGSTMGIAAICDETGQILGMMPHAEDFVRREHHPNWRRMDKNLSIDGLEFFKNIVSVAKQL